MGGDWSAWTTFFADGLADAATQTRARMLALADVRTELKESIEQSRLRTAKAHALVDLAIVSLTFTIRDAAAHLGVQNPGANKLIDSLVDLNILAPVDERTHGRRCHAPAVMRVLLGVRA